MGTALAISPNVDDPLDGPKLEIFDKVPPWAIVHAARDNSTAPLILEGEVAVIEGDGRTGRIPQDGRLYLIEYVSPPQHQYERERRSRDIIQAHRDPKGRWWARPYLCQTAGRGVIIFSDGPYRDEIMLAEKILGAVVGIYRPQGSDLPGVARIT